MYTWVGGGGGVVAARGGGEVTQCGLSVDGHTSLQYAPRRE